MATTRDPRVSMAAAYQRMRRVNRSPRHTFNLWQRPFSIQPFMIAPVLPGETLTNLVHQARAVTFPVKAPLTGWWLDTYFFYVKHRDLKLRDLAVGMHLNPAASLGALYEFGRREWTYFKGNGVDWLKQSMEVIVEEYFRDEEQKWDNYLDPEGVPKAQIKGNDVLDSYTKDADKRERDLAVDLDGDGEVEASEIGLAMAEWNAMRDAGLVDMDYEDYAKTYGANVRQEEASPELHRPELMAYWSEWQYPTNTVDPSNGQPRSAVSWSIAKQANKKRFFKEHGFIIGIQVVRPKTYKRNHQGTFSAYMMTQKTWLPAVLNDNPELSYMKFADNEGPIVANATDGYWVDTRDLFVHGEQFVYSANTADILATSPELTSDAPGVGLPEGAGNRRYPANGDISALFVGNDPYLRVDGVTSMTIKGRQIDSTPGSKI